MRIALVHDGIFCRGGAERVLLNFCKAFPNAPIYTSIYDRLNTYPEFSNYDVRTTWIQKIVPREKWYKRTFFPLGLYAMQSHDFSDYDVVLAATTNSAKYIQIHSSALVINYCFTPFRLAWNPNSYNLYCNSKGFKRYFLDVIISRIRQIDLKYSKRADQYIAMTYETSKRLRKAYNPKNTISIINPSIDVKKYFISDEVEDYYLVVSRLEKYKKVDLVINAFNKLGYRLIIVGSGIEKENLLKIAKTNIEFIEGIDDSELSSLYSKCKAFIFPQHEDYGLTPLEANASGRPVIAYNKGGIESTMIPFDEMNPKLPFTALFFDEQNDESLIEAVNKLITLKENTGFIREHAMKFDDDIFIEKIKLFIDEHYHQHKKKNS